MILKTNRPLLAAQTPDPPRQPTERRIECPACSEDMEDTGRRERGGRLQIMKCPKCQNEAAVDVPKPGNSTQR